MNFLRKRENNPSIVNQLLSHIQDRVNPLNEAKELYDPEKASSSGMSQSTLQNSESQRYD